MDAGFGTHLDWRAVGRVDEIPRLGARVVETRGGDVAVFRTADDRVFAPIAAQVADWLARN